MNARIVTACFGILTATGAMGCLADGGGVEAREEAVVEAGEACGAGCGMVPSPAPAETWYPTYDACKTQACERPSSVFCSPSEGGWVGICGNCEGTCPFPSYLCIGPTSGGTGQADICDCDFVK